MGVNNAINYEVSIMPYGNYRRDCLMLRAFDPVDTTEEKLNERIESALGCDNLGRKIVHNRSGDEVGNPAYPSYKVASQIYKPLS